VTTSIGSGLGASWGFAKETVVGTFVAPARWLPFKDDKFKGEKKIVQSQALHQGGLYELGGRRRLTFHGAKGAVSLELQDKQLGLLFQAMIGSTPTITQQGTTSAWLQTHQPGDLAGISLSVQAGRPMTTGNVQGFSYNGVKVTDWELTCKTADLAFLTVTLDGWDESTATTYTVPVQTTSHPLAWVDGKLLLGGSVSMVSGVATVSGAPAAPIGTVKSVTVKGQNVQAVDRQQIGSLTKSEQLANGFRKYTGDMEVEFANLTDMYNAYYSDTPLVLQLNFQGQLISGAFNASANFLFPQVYFEGEPPETDGPQILTVKVPFTVVDDGSTVPLQIQYQSTDSTV
jgi:hypothetical protein